MVSKKPGAVIRVELAALRDEDRLTPDLVFRDPYFLDFLGMPQRYRERDLEDAILWELEAFLLELGTDFTFVARQKRITVDYEDYYLDLLFYHRRLQRLVAIDLKSGRFFIPEGYQPLAGGCGATTGREAEHVFRAGKGEARSCWPPPPHRRNGVNSPYLPA